MMYAEQVTDIPAAFRLKALSMEELDLFFCDETMEIRTGDEYKSPIWDISEACQTPSERNVFLLLGHSGCGKSTELNKMSSELTANGYNVSIIKCAVDLDLFNPAFSDLLILMGDALLGIAKKTGCKLNRKLEEKFVSYWSTEKRIEYRQKISNRSSEWLDMLNAIAEIVTEKLDGKQPVLIFEDLDKINDLETMYKIFSNEATALTGIPFPVVYTFPIALSYDPRFASLEKYYAPKILPMIKLETVEGAVYQEGIDVMMKIIEKRAKLSLFEEKVLDALIIKTGGSLRDLFSCIVAASKVAKRRETAAVSMKDAEISLKELKSSLTRRIERRNYAFLADICEGNRRNIEDKAMLLEMLEAHAVLEYNSDRWHNTHPLITEFLIEQGHAQK
ncbi:MAG: ATP-binding protein [Clostridiales bacterium]|nr:ATP-binding protein [Clostridiales bacterium]